MVPLPTIYDTVMAVHDGIVERALVPIENSLEGSVNATLDALAMETEDVAIVGEVVHPIRHCLIARTALELVGDRGRHLPSAGQRPVRALHPHPAARRAGGRRERRRPTRCARSPSTTGPWAALGQPRRRRALRLPGAAGRRRGRRRERDAVRLAGPDRRAPVGPRRTRPVQDRDRVLGRRLRGAGLAGGLPLAVRRPRASTSPGSSRAPASRGWGATCSSSTSRGTRTTPPSPPRWRAERARRAPARARLVPRRLTALASPAAQPRAPRPAPERVLIRSRSSRGRSERHKHALRA